MERATGQLRTSAARRLPFSAKYYKTTDCPTIVPVMEKGLIALALENIHVRRTYYLLLTVVVLAGLLAAAYRSLYDDVTYNMEVRLQGAANGSPWTASNVMNLDFHAEVPILNNRGIFLHTVGEAIAVDIEGHRPFFVVNSPDDAWPRPIAESCNFEYRDDFLPHLRLEAVRSLAKPCDLAPSKLPRIVRFADESNPNTLEIVGLDDLRREGVEIQRVTLHRTTAPVSAGLAERLPWLDAGAPHHDELPVMVPFEQNGDQLMLRFEPSSFIYRY